MSASQQRRRESRARDLEIPAEVCRVEEESAHPATIVNLGPEGAFILSGAPLPVDATVRLRFRIDSFPIPFDLRGEVRWLSDGGAGLQFTAVGPYARAALDDYCQRLLDESRGR